MRQAATELEMRTERQGLVEVTRPIARWVAEPGMTTGLRTVFCRPTPASLPIQANPAPGPARR